MVGTAQARLCPPYEGFNATNGAWLARMSGSGATCFAIYENTAEAGRAAEQLRRDHPGWWVHAGTLS